ncbi:DUF1580 domain-containing protein [Stieleria sp. ICT_E10.1]|uniref:DUF1580 domain-containing protein n=1 Tax=Stieleria sedimenti TaxID=2976331 RepID=UPI00218091B3|nr:DUF1580 domain-containing protein [Stieleria sedimenti]MCS7466126.1 DUF1580 domain-containing protein [Stieleria sedimenti]
MRNKTLSRVLTEDAITLAEVPAMLPGRRPHVSTVWRWYRTGVRGVRLEAVKIGRSVITSRQAVTRFLTHLNASNGDGGEK